VRLTHYYIIIIIIIINVPLFHDALQSQYTTKSDVWAFGVTLWEVLSYAQERPLSSLSDTDVIANLERMRAAGGSDVTADEAGWIYPERPGGCPRETYDLMTACWSRNVERRPSFREAHMFLQRLNAGYSPFQTTAGADRQMASPSGGVVPTNLHY